MKSSFLKFAVAASITFSAAAAVAQNGSDATNPQGSLISGGAFVPLPVPNSAGSSVTTNANAGPAGAASVTSTIAGFTAGGSVTSTITNQPIAPAAVSLVGALIAGGSPSSVAAVTASLQAAGASPSAVAALTQALADLATVTAQSAPAAIARAAAAYNSVIANAPASFFTSQNGGPPATILAIQAAISPMVTAISK